MQALMVELRVNSPVPLHDRVYQTLRLLIDEAALQPGQALPSQKSLAAHLRVSRPTVATPLHRLEAEGLINRTARDYIVTSTSLKPAD